ncbi:MAG: hypothetical protein ACNA8W_15700, partial [Bradymonadaceae bacterium]
MNISLTRPFEGWFLLGLACILFIPGCMSKEERAKNVIERGLEKCRDAEGDFFDVTLFDGSRQTVLREACLEPASDAELLTEWSAMVKTGPLEWVAGIDKGTSAWVLTNVQWEDLDRARRVRADRDAPADDFARAEGYFESAQEALPKNTWIRLERLRNLLDLRGKSRANDDPDPATIGPRAQAYFEELLAFAAETDQADVGAQARLMVIDHLQKYRRRQQAGLDSIGSRDEWLEKSIEEAKKEGKPEEAAEIQKDLDERRERAVTDRVVLTERLEVLQT